jgi:hypothetical protein
MVVKFRSPRYLSEQASVKYEMETRSWKLLIGLIVGVLLSK